MEAFSYLVGGGFVWMLFLWLGCALLASTVADSKGRNGFVWFIAGGLFNILALIAIAGMPSLLVNLPNKRTHVRCPDCREFIYKDATVCKCCGCKITPAAQDPALTNPFKRLFG
jgi:hypothetical protein